MELVAKQTEQRARDSEHDLDALQKRKYKIHIINHKIIAPNGVTIYYLTVIM